MDQLPDNFTFGPLNISPDPALDNYSVHQKLYWFNNQTHRMCIDSMAFAATVFKFSVWTVQLITVGGKTVGGKTVTDLIQAGKRSVHGSMSLVTQEKNLLGREFTLLIYDSTGKHVATIHQAVFTMFTQEYSLDNQNVFEAEWFARSMEPKSEASE